ncbi:MAG: hypothetical protein ACLS7B_01675 [Hominilimicola sp.]
MKKIQKHDKLKKILEDEKARENERKTLEKAVGLKMNLNIAMNMKV